MRWNKTRSKILLDWSRKISGDVELDIASWSVWRRAINGENVTALWKNHRLRLMTGLVKLQGNSGVIGNYG